MNNTKSQQQAIKAILAQSVMKHTVKTMHECANGRLAVTFVVGDKENWENFTYTLYIGKRGKVFETEEGDY